MVQIKDIGITKTVADDSDFLIMQTPLGETYNIKKVHLFAGLSSGGGNSIPAGAEINLTFSADGDDKGIFYYFGSKAGTEVWGNPISKGVGISCSGETNGSVEALVDRQESGFYLQSAANSWIKITLSKSLKCNYYSLRNRNYSGVACLRNWKLQGSGDGITWIDLDVQQNNSSINDSSQWLSLPVTSQNQVGYKIFRLLQTGLDSSGYNFLCLGEIELYGILLP